MPPIFRRTSVPIALVALWDFSTTVLGVATIMEANTDAAYLVAFVAAMVFTGTLFLTGAFGSRMPMPLVPVWLTAFVLDLYTSLVGHVALFLNKPFEQTLGNIWDSLGSMDASQTAIVLAASLGVAASTIVLSLIVFKREW